MNIDVTTLLRQILQPDNAIRKQAEVVLEEARKYPNDLARQFLMVIKTPGQKEIRNMACVLMRRIFVSGVTPTYENMSPDAQLAFKSELIAILRTETDRDLRRSVVDIVGELGGVLLSSEDGQTAHQEKWPELLPFMFELSKSPNSVLRESALLIFTDLCEDLGHMLLAYQAVLYEIFAANLNDESDLLTRLAALRAITTFLRHMDHNETMPYQNLIPPIMATLRQALNAGEEDSVVKALEALCDIAESDSRFFIKYIRDVFAVIIQIAGSNSVPDSARHMSCEFLCTVCEKAAGMVRKQQDLVKQIFEIFTKMILSIEVDDEATMEWLNEREDNEDVEITSYDVGQECLYRLSNALGGKLMAPIVFGTAQTLLHHADWRYRHAGVLIIGIMAGGCRKTIENELEKVIGMFVPMFQDPHPRVKWACCLTVGHLAAEFSPVFQQQGHASVIPNVLNIAQTAIQFPRLRARACLCLVYFCEDCPIEVLKMYLSQLINVMLECAKSTNIEVIEKAITTIACIAGQAKKDFLPYYDVLMPMLKSSLQQSMTKEYRQMRGKIMECISLIAVAVGKEKFLPDAQSFLSALIQTQQAPMESDDPQLAYILESSARVCKCLGSDFVQFLPYVIPYVLQTAEKQADIVVHGDDGEHVLNQNEDMTLSLGDKRVTIKTSAVEEKATACSMLARYAEDMGAAFLPYVEPVLKVMLPLLRYYFAEDIRIAAAIVMPALVEVIKAANLDPSGLISNILSHLLPAIEEEPQLDVLDSLLKSLERVLDEAGPNPFNDANLLLLQKCLNTLFTDYSDRRQDREQRAKVEDVDEEEAEAIEEEREGDEEVIQQLGDVLGALMAKEGLRILPILEPMLPAFAELTHPQHSEGDIIFGLCVWCDALTHLGGQALKYYDLFAPSAFGHATSRYPFVRQAATYSLGKMAEFSGERFDLDLALMKLQSVLTDPKAHSKENRLATENAISALGRILKFQGVRRPEILNHFAHWLNMLPIRDDGDEAKFVYPWLCEIIENQNSTFLGDNMSNLPKFVTILCSVLGSDIIADDAQLNERIRNLLQRIKMGVPAAYQSGWHAVSSEDKARVSHIL